MKRILSLVVAASIIITPAAFAAVSDEDFAALREQLAVVSSRLDELAEENARLRAAQNQADATINEVKTTVADMPAASEIWTDRVKLGGDFRYRYEYIDPEGSDLAPATEFVLAPISRQRQPITSKLDSVLQPVARIPYPPTRRLAAAARPRAWC